MKIMVILGGGGHTSQLLKLVDMLGKKYQYEYVVESSDNLSPKKIKLPGNVMRFKKTRNIGEFFLISIFKQIPACLSAIKLMRQSDSDVVITCGPNFAAPIIFIGKIFGRKIVFMESWSRIYRKSYLGIFAYRFADLFFVQWPEMKKLYPKAIYAGRFA